MKGKCPPWQISCRTSKPVATRLGPSLSFGRRRTYLQAQHRATDGQRDSTSQYTMRISSRLRDTTMRCRPRRQLGLLIAARLSVWSPVVVAAVWWIGINVFVVVLCVVLLCVVVVVVAVVVVVVCVCC